jgi:hypothetical protein
MRQSSGRKGPARGISGDDGRSRLNVHVTQRNASTVAKRMYAMHTDFTSIVAYLSIYMLPLYVLQST